MPPPTAPHPSYPTRSRTPRAERRAGPSMAGAHPNGSNGYLTFTLRIPLPPALPFHLPRPLPYSVIPLLSLTL